MFIPGLITFLALLLVGPHSEANLNTYPRIAGATSRDRILIVAPHIDDEANGAAGYAADAIANGAEVYVVFLTAGDCNGFSARILNKTLGPTMSNYLSVGQTRIREAHDAMQFLGVAPSRYFILGYPDGGLKTILDNRRDIVRSRATGERAVPYADAMSPGSPYSFANLMVDMERVVEIANPTVVIAPVQFDLHPDHSAASEITDLALEDLHVKPYRLGYLVHGSRVPLSLLRLPERALTPPTRMRKLDWATYPLTSAVQKKKDVMLQSYKSQRPYTAILRNAFVRTNELFFVYREATELEIPPMHAMSPATARIPIAR